MTCPVGNQVEMFGSLLLASIPIERAASGSSITLPGVRQGMSQNPGAEWADAAFLSRIGGGCG
jgi:hypothetical protein